MSVWERLRLGIEVGGWRLELEDLEGLVDLEI